MGKTNEFRVLVATDGSVSTEAPLRAVLATVEEMKSDVVVVGARGCGGVRRLLLGSVAEGVFNDCRVPVLVVR